MRNMLYQYGASARRICRLCCIDLVVILFIVIKKKKAYIVKFVIVKISLFFFVTPEAKPRC